MTREQADLESPGVSRRLALRGAAVAGVAAPLLAACGDEPDESTGSTSSETTSPSETTSSPAESTEPAAEGFATTADIPEGGGVIFEDEGVVVTQPVAGDFKGFTNICTHKGCKVAEVTGTINCKCHGSQFSIEDGSNVTAPEGMEAGSLDPLAPVEITVDGDAISLA